MKKSKIQLAPEEQIILDAFEAGEINSIADVKAETKRIQAIAKNNRQKNAVSVCA